MKFNTGNKYDKSIVVIKMELYHTAEAVHLDKINISPIWMRLLEFMKYE